MKQLWATISDEGGKLGDNFIFLLAMSLENAISLWLISLVLSFKHVISNPRLCFQMTYAVSHSVFLKITYYSHSKVNSSLWYKTSKWELPAGLVARSQSFHFSSLGSIPGLGTDIPHQATAQNNGNNKNNNKNSNWQNSKLVIYICVCVYICVYVYIYKMWMLFTSLPEEHKRNNLQLFREFFFYLTD